MKKIVLLLSLTVLVNFTFAQRPISGIFNSDSFSNLNNSSRGLVEIPEGSNVLKIENQGNYLTGSEDSYILIPRTKLVILSNQNAEMAGNALNGYCLNSPLNLAQLADTTKVKTPKEMYNFYMQKRKTNYIAGFILLGSGTALFSIGLIDELNHILSNDERAGVLIITGGVIALTSIPFLIAGRSNKRKAYLSLRRDAASMGSKSPGSFSYAALSFKLQL